MHKIEYDSYMAKGWDTKAKTEYIRGSRHNKIGMSLMLTYYALIIGMIIRGIWVVLT